MARKRQCECFIRGYGLRYPVLLLCSSLAVLSCFNQEESGEDRPFERPATAWNPETYVVYQAGSPVNVDGDLTEPDWALASWTHDFVDIRGLPEAVPWLRTRVKLLWDDANLYIAAELAEPHVWAKLTERDAVIYQDNDFEVFIDPDGDSHEYYELDINALGAERDLMLIRPYRDGGRAITDWDIKGLQSGVFVSGTINDPSDRDVGWSVEIAIPWRAVGEAARRPAPPEAGDQWSVNFSRVQWQTEVVEGEYVTQGDSDAPRMPEANWVWSPQGLAAMHYPEMWGVIQFSANTIGSVVDEFRHVAVDSVKQTLYQLYYAQRLWFEQHGRYARSLAELGLLHMTMIPGYSWPPTIVVSPTYFEVVVEGRGGKIFTITHEGRFTRRGPTDRD